MDSHNFYFEQLVIDSDLDDIYSDANAMERLAIARAHGLCQGSPAAAATLGGILSGLVVTKVDSKTVQVTAGSARDTDGKFVDVTSNCTVSLVNQGQTDVGDVTAEGDGTPINITAAKEAWLSLYLQYGEVLSDVREDGNAEQVSYRITESFRFYIGLGAEATAPATDRVGISSYLDVSVIHLADILLDADENIRVINPGSGDLDVICGSNEDFDRFTGYTAMTGRRSDWVAMEDPTYYPQFAAQDTYLRAGTPRDGLIDLVKKLQVQAAAPAGAGLIGARARTGAVGADGTSISSLTAGSVESQLYALLLEISKRLPKAGSVPPPFMDDFCYVPKQDSCLWSPEDDSPFWGAYSVGGGTCYLSTAGSEVQLVSGSSAGNYHGIVLGYSTDGTDRKRWLYHAYDPCLVMAVRIRFGDLTDTVLRFGLTGVSLTDASTRIECVADAPAGTTQAHVLNSAGGGEHYSSSVWAPDGDAETLVLRVHDDGAASIQLGYDGTQAEAQLTAGSFVNGYLFFYIFAQSKTGLHTGIVNVDSVAIGQRD